MSERRIYWLALAAFWAVIGALLSGCASPQPPGGDLWRAVQHEEAQRKHQ